MSAGALATASILAVVCLPTLIGIPKLIIATAVLTILCLAHFPGRAYIGAMYVLCLVRRYCFICYAHTSWSNCCRRTAYTRCVMSAETIIALMLAANAVFKPRSSCALAYRPRVHCCTYSNCLLSYLLMRGHLCSCLNTYCRIATLGSIC